MSMATDERASSSEMIAGFQRAAKYSRTMPGPVHWVLLEDDLQLEVRHSLGGTTRERPIAAEFERTGLPRSFAWPWRVRGGGEVGSSPGMAAVRDTAGNGALRAQPQLEDRASQPQPHDRGVRRVCNSEVDAW